MAGKMNLQRQISALLALGQGRAAAEVAVEHGVHLRTIRRWSRRARTEPPPADEVFAAAIAAHDEARSERVRAQLLCAMLRAVAAQAEAARPVRGRAR